MLPFHVLRSLRSAGSLAGCELAPGGRPVNEFAKWKGRQDMYTLAIYMNPDSAKTPQLLKELRERNDISNGEGFPHMVAQQIFAPEPVIVSVTQFQDLAAFQAWTERNGSDAAYQASGQRILSTLRHQAHIQMHEALAQTAPTGHVAYFLSARSFAAAGKVRELRLALEEGFAATPSKGTVLKVLQREVVPEEGANFTTNFGFSSLAGLDELMHDSALGVANADMAHLLNAPVRQRLYRVVMPFVR
jgi:heme-degrading monooxygenase HmoA